MGVINNAIKISDLEKGGGGGGGSIEQRLSHLEDEYTDFVTYSAQEKLIGEFVNGENIYRKTIYIPSLPNKTTLEVDHGIGGFSRILKYDASCKDGDNLGYGNSTTMPTITVSNNHVSVYFTHEKAVIYSDTDRSNWNCYLTMYYLKAEVD